MHAEWNSFDFESNWFDSSTNDRRMAWVRRGIEGHPLLPECNSFRRSGGERPSPASGGHSRTIASRQVIGHRWIGRGRLVVFGRHRPTDDLYSGATRVRTSGTFR